MRVPYKHTYFFLILRPFCKIFSECFKEQVYHKYRTSVVRTKDASQSAHILVYYSGTPSDNLLLHLTQLAAMEDPNRKNLDKFTLICFENDLGKRKVLEATVQNYNISIAFFDISEILFGNADGLQKLLESGNSENYRVELERFLHDVALVKAAASLGIYKVYVSETCTQMAINIIADTCTARGVSLPWRLAMCQRFLLPEKEVSIIRPLRDVVDGEVKEYNRLIKHDQKMSPETSRLSGETVKLGQSNEHHKDDAIAGIGNAKECIPSAKQDKDETLEDTIINKEQPKTLYGLSSRFIDSLDKENSATVSTVVRTAAKVKTATSEFETWKSSCALCMAPLLDSAPFCLGCHTLSEAMPTLDASILPLHTIELLRSKTSS